MKGLLPLSLSLLGTSAALSIDIRDDEDAKVWKPITKDPHFFTIKVDDYCSYPDYVDDVPDDAIPDAGVAPVAPIARRQFYPPPPGGPGVPPQGPGGYIPPGGAPRYCPLAGYAIRLEKGSVIATPYEYSYDSALPTFFVDDDTQMYTVSKEPLQVYVDSVTGALQYTKVGWLPPNAISIGFYHTGNNPLGVMHPSSAYVTWPSTFIDEKGGNFLLCPLGQTRQYKVYVDFVNFYPQGVVIDSKYCSLEHLAAINANPWKKSSYKDTKYVDYGYKSDDDDKYGYDTMKKPEYEEKPSYEAKAVYDEKKPSYEEKPVYDEKTPSYDEKSGYDSK